MWRTEYTRWVVGAGSFAAETAIAVDWAYYSTMTVSPPVYVGLLIFFGLLLVGPPVNGLQPSVQLRAMEVRLAQAIAESAGRAGRTPWETSVRDNPRIRSIIRNLDKLKTAHPGLDSDGRTRMACLAQLQGEAEAGELRTARKVWDEMQAERDR